MTDRAFRLAITEHDVILMYLPLFHLFAFSEGMLTSMATGARQVLIETFDADESLALLEGERATVLHGFDTHYKELVEAHARRPRDVSSVRTGILAAGMASSTPVARAARALFGPLVSGYGMSEFGAGAAMRAGQTGSSRCEESANGPGTRSASSNQNGAISPGARARSWSGLYLIAVHNKPRPPPKPRADGCAQGDWDSSGRRPLALMGATDS